MTTVLQIALYSTLVFAFLTTLALFFSLASKWLVDNSEENEAH